MNHNLLDVLVISGGKCGSSTLKKYCSAEAQHKRVTRTGSPNRRWPVGEYVLRRGLHGFSGGAGADCDAWVMRKPQDRHAAFRKQSPASLVENDPS